MADNPNGPYASLKTTVEHLVVSMESMAARVETIAEQARHEIRGLYARLDQIGRPDWKAYAAWGALVIAAWVALSTVTSQFTVLRIEPIEGGLQQLQADMKYQVELERVERQRVREEAMFARSELRDDLKNMRADVFPKGVHEQRWNLYDTEIAALDGKITDLSKRLGDLYNPSDKLKELQTQIDAIRTLLNGFRPITPPG